MQENEFRMVLRVTMQLTGQVLGKVEGKGTDSETQHNYSGNHIAIFECELKSPPALSLIDHTYKEYVMAHRLNFGNWKLVDLDNFMKGNPFFSEYLTEE